MLALAILTAVPLGAFPAYGTKTEVQEEEKKKSTLEEEKKKVEDALKNLEGLKSDTAAYVKQLDSNLEALSQELSDLEKQIATKEADISATKAQLEEAKQVEANQYASMKLRIKYMYERGNTSFADVIMASGSLTEFMSRAEYVSKIAAYDREKLQEYAETKDMVEKREAELQYEREELLGMQESTKAKQEDKIKQIEAEIKRKEEEARKKAESEGKKYNTVNIGDISFIWPCPSSSRITSNFGDRESPTEGASSNHKGVDIGASTGADILAAASGEVIISTYSYSAGNYIMINHGGGVYTVYMHCSQLLASVGEQVKQGQVIAKVGSTGYSTGPHLHFGVRTGGTYVNPLNYVSP